MKDLWDLRNEKDMERYGSKQLKSYYPENNMAIETTVA